MTDTTTAVPAVVTTGDRVGLAAARGPAASPLSPAGPSEQELHRLAALAAQALSPATRRAYLSDWRRWQAWCAGRGAATLPADAGLVAVYLEEHAATHTTAGDHAYAPATLTRWTAALNQLSRAAGYPAPGEHPVVQRVLAAVKRTRQHAPRRRDPLLLADLTQVCEHMHASARLRAARVAARRDTAVLLVGFFGGFRRAELAALQLADVAYHPADGLHVRLRASKTDQEGDGMVKALPFRDPPQVCPVCAVLSWAQVVAAWDEAGRAGVMRTMRTPDPEGHICGPHDHPPLPRSQRPLFRSLHRAGSLRGPLSGHAINQMIQRRAAQAGLDPERLTDIGGHSLRAGLVTEAYRAGATAEEIAQQTGHRSLAVLASYRREHAPLQGNAVTKIGTPGRPGNNDEDDGDVAADG